MLGNGLLWSKKFRAMENQMEKKFQNETLI